MEKKPVEFSTLCLAIFILSISALASSARAVEMAYAWG